MFIKTARFLMFIGFTMMLSACASNHNGHEMDHMGHQDQQANETTSEYSVTYTFPQEKPSAQQPTKLEIAIADSSNEVVEQFEINHEKLLHLIAVNHDLSQFMHLHPEYDGQGKFHLETTFPVGGSYKLFADFVPAGGEATTASDWVEVQGDEAPHQDLIPTEKNSEGVMLKNVDGKEVELKPTSLQANQDVSLIFTIRDAANQTPIQNLQPYLGAIGHVVIISADAEQYLHVHPMNGKSTGPEAVFHTIFPESGIYKIWAQFQHEDRVFTADYVLEVKS